MVPANTPSSLTEMVSLGGVVWIVRRQVSRQVGSLGSGGDAKGEGGGSDDLFQHGRSSRQVEFRLETLCFHRKQLVCLKRNIHFFQELN
jgi:hypothetical protein